MARIKTSLGGAALVAAFCLGSVALGQSRTVTLLDKGEPNDAMTAHAGYLWVGKSRLDFASHYTIEAYDAQDNLAATAMLPHSATFAYPYGERSILVFGTGQSPNLTQYSIVEMRGGALDVRTIRIPMEAWGNLWVGTVDGREYFTDMGGNGNDAARDRDPTLPSQTVFSMARGRARYLSSRLTMPLDGVAVGGHLYVAHGQAIGDPRTNLVKINPVDGRVTPLFPSYRAGLAKVLRLEGLPLVAVSESQAGKVLLVDVRTDRLVAEVDGLGAPRALAQFGHCVLAGDPWSNTIGVVDVSALATGGSAEVVASLPVGLPSHEFRMLRGLAVDAARGKIYARSNYACNPVMTACNEDYNRVVVLEGDAVEAVAARCARTAG